MGGKEKLNENDGRGQRATSLLITSHVHSNFHTI